MGYGGGP
jgi:hypothetical protein